MLERAIAMMRVGVALALALCLAPRWARADEKDVREACASAAERAQSARQSRRYRTARDELLACARPECPPVIRIDCGTWLGQVEALMPSLVFRARDERGRDLFDVDVDLDGARILKKLDGVAVPIDPGVHRVHMSVPGREPADVEILVAEGEKTRVVTVDLRSPQQAVVPPPVVESRPVLPWVAMGVGVASLVAFIGLEVSAHGQLSNLQMGCGVNGMCTDAQVSPVRAQFDAAGALLGIGAACVVGGAIGFIVSYAGKRPAPPPSAWIGRPLVSF